MEDGKPLVGMAGIHSGIRIRQKTQLQRLLTRSLTHPAGSQGTSLRETRNSRRALTTPGNFFRITSTKLSHFSTLSFATMQISTLTTIICSFVRLISQAHTL
jgi:hypothetical protein